MNKEDLRWCSRGGFVGSSVSTTTRNLKWKNLAIQKVWKQSEDKRDIAEEWRKLHAEAKRRKEEAESSSSRSCQKITRAELMDKCYEYFEREESYELRTGKVRSCLSWEKYFEIAREEGWLTDILDDEPEQNSTDEAMESAGDVEENNTTDAADDVQPPAMQEKLVCRWQKVVKSSSQIKNQVLHFPAAVIKEIFMEPRSYIDLHDTDSGITYQCVFKSRENMTEKFLSRGWLKFAKEKELSKGDVLLFSVEHPPVERILVKVERGQH
ncbi:unnamed protein product [Vicia faba]|uniref:TF-B3 domain-containing protein n=1 Tax=Vicia faba TaxID=3906 RepID=A0AAV1AQ69_VICFA|nr:unnamed protein product [Vicia faba]